MAGETMVFHPPSAINTAGGWVYNQSLFCLNKLPVKKELS